MWRSLKEIWQNSLTPYQKISFRGASTNGKLTGISMSNEKRVYWKKWLFVLFSLGKYRSSLDTFWTYLIYIYIYIYKIKSKVSEGDPKATLFPGLLHFTLDPYLIMLSVKQGGIKYHFLSHWYDSTWDWMQVSRAIGKHSNHHANVQVQYIYTYIYIWGCMRERKNYYLCYSVDCLR